MGTIPGTVQSIPTGQKYESIQNFVPFLQAMTDVKKYQMQKQDEAEKLAFLTMLQSGRFAPTNEAPFNWGGQQFKPLSVDEFNLLHGRYPEEREKLKQEVEKLKAETTGLNMFSQGEGMAGYTPGMVTLKGPGGATREYYPPTGKTTQQNIFQWTKRRTPETVPLPSGTPKVNLSKMSSNQVKVYMVARKDPRNQGVTDEALAQYVMEQVQ